MIYLYRHKTSVEQVKATLKENGWQRVRPYRYWRFEKYTSDNKRLGVELSASETIIEIWNYCDSDLPNETLKSIDDEMSDYFKQSIVAFTC